MNTKSTTLIAGLVLVIAGSVFAFFYLNEQRDSPANTRTPDQASPNSPSTSAPLAPDLARTTTLSPIEKPAPDLPPLNETTSNTSNPATATAPPPPKKAPYQPGPSKFKRAVDPQARQALALVGADLEAEMVWLTAINNPTIPAEERKDLIEDLNEDGISNPGRPTLNDLPLIKSRIQMIERLLPSAIDKVNADAFREAHKDLVNMRDRLSVN